MRSNSTDIWEAVVAMRAAHNEMGKVAGFSPAQWALGRSLSPDEKLHEGHRDAAHLSRTDPEVYDDAPEG